MAGCVLVLCRIQKRVILEIKNKTMSFESVVREILIIAVVTIAILWFASMCKKYSKCGPEETSDNQTNTDPPDYNDLPICEGQADPPPSYESIGQIAVYNCDRDLP